MDAAKPLPRAYVQRYRGWHATQFAENRSWYARLAEDGQRPRAFIIACCDSRVHVTSVFGADSGEFFIHRNIANLVPPFRPDGDLHGTSATIEYAINTLRVSHVLVMGHSHCGGVQGCLKMCSGEAPELEEQTSFVGRWMDLLRPAYDRVRDIADPHARQRALEQEGVLVSLTNLIDFPFVAARVTDGSLSLHGVWHDIATGGLEVYDAEKRKFAPV